MGVCHPPLLCCLFNKILIWLFCSVKHASKGQIADIFQLGLEIFEFIWIIERSPRNEDESLICYGCQLEYF